MDAASGGAAAAIKGIPAEYEVLHRCGEGTFGQVFLCRSKEGRHVAIKTIKQEAAKQARARTTTRCVCGAVRRVVRSDGARRVLPPCEPSCP